MELHKNIEEDNIMEFMNRKREAQNEPKHNPVLPHERRKEMVTIQFDDKDWAVFKEVFGGEDTATAAMDIICGAPPEIQNLAVQVHKMISEEAA